MRPVRLVVTGVANSPPVAISNYTSPCNVGIAAAITGTATYTVQFTFDDIYARNYNPATGTWYNSTDTTVVNATANAASNIAFPVMAVRLSVSASTGSVAFTVIQAGER